MVVDFRKDAAFVRDMLVRCVLRYSIAARGQISKPFHPPITRIDITYSVGDGTSIPYFCLELDTKPGGEPDGDPTHKMYDYAERPEWGSAIRYLVETEGKRWPVVLADGRAVECDSETFERHIGEMFVEAMKAARDQGVFRDLPKGERCEFGVELFGGNFGWPLYEDRGKENLA